MANDDFTGGDATQVAYQCTIDITGSDRALDPGAKLSDYNVQTDQELSLIKQDIRDNTGIGLPAYGRTIDIAELGGLANDWTIQQLSDVIYDKSTPASKPSSAAAFRSESFALAETGSPRTLSAYVRRSPIRAVFLSAVAGFALGILLGRASR